MELKFYTKEVKILGTKKLNIPIKPSRSEVSPPSIFMKLGMNTYLFKEKINLTPLDAISYGLGVIAL